jgi:hypothetical protein
MTTCASGDPSTLLAIERPSGFTYRQTKLASSAQRGKSSRSVHLRVARCVCRFLSLHLVSEPCLLLRHLLNSAALCSSDLSPLRVSHAPDNHYSCGWNSWVASFSYGPDPGRTLQSPRTDGMILLVLSAGTLVASDVGIALSHPSVRDPQHDTLLYSMDADNHTAAWISMTSLRISGSPDWLEEREGTSFYAKVSR